MGTTLAAMQKNNDDKFGAMKDLQISMESRLMAMYATHESRLAAIENQKKGMGEMWGVIVGVGGLLFGALGIASRMFFR
jgi:hypothetical protein